MDDEWKTNEDNIIEVDDGDKGEDGHEDYKEVRV